MNHKVFDKLMSSTTRGGILAHLKSSVGELNWKWDYEQENDLLFASKSSNFAKSNGQKIHLVNARETGDEQSFFLPLVKYSSINM